MTKDTQKIAEDIYYNLVIAEDYCLNNRGFEKLEAITPLISHNRDLADKLYILLCEENL